jgi:hypothetical protein
VLSRLSETPTSVSDLKISPVNFIVVLQTDEKTNR